MNNEKIDASAEEVLGTFLLDEKIAELIAGTENHYAEADSWEDLAERITQTSGHAAVGAFDYAVERGRFDVALAIAPALVAVSKGIEAIETRKAKENSNE